VSRRWTWCAARQRALEILREEGIKSLWFRTLGELGYRRLVLMERRLDRPIAGEADPTPLVVDLLQSSDVEEYHHLRPDIEVAEVRRRLALGHWCFVVRHQGRMVHTGWAAAGRAHVEFLDIDIVLAPGDIYQYGSFTAPDARGREFAGARLAAMACHLQREGYRRLIAAVLPENAVAFRPLEKAGYRRCGSMSVVRLGRYRRQLRRLHGSAPAGRADLPAHGYWDGVLAAMRGGPAHEEWRAYMQRVYRRLLAEWLPAERRGRGLKTDLFEEAVSDAHLLHDLGTGAVGIDLSPAIAAAARTRLTRAGRPPRVVVGDLRAIPLRDGSITSILAGSSLDHFPDKTDIVRAVHELARLLPPSGILVVTFDNPHNPIVWLRNRLPFAWLNRLRLVPYYVGATLGVTEARSTLTACGLTVTDVTAVAHAPRVLAMGLAALAERTGRRALRARVAGWLDRCEALGAWPTRYRTGYYVALRAEKRERPAASLDPVEAGG
jgi:SAM-dependent methyltransferase/RimJ/RimL family protein N-acetyltransferase